MSFWWLRGGVKVRVVPYFSWERAKRERASEKITPREVSLPAACRLYQIGLSAITCENSRFSSLFAAEDAGGESKVEFTRCPYNLRIWIYSTALSLFKEEVGLLSKPERNFGEGWALLVEFIAATHFQTNLNETAEQQASLPQRILRTWDIAPFIWDISPAQNRVILAINVFRTANSVPVKGWLLEVWRKAMCSPQGRKVGLQLLKDVAEGRLANPLQKMKSLIDAMVKPCSNKAE